MAEQEKNRFSYETDVYHIERSIKGEHYHVQTPWRLNVHINPKDMQTAYDTLAPYAEEKDLTIAFAKRDVRKAYEDESVDSPPMVVVRHSASLDDPQAVLTEMEHMLDKAEVRPGKQEDFNGKPVRGSKYMDATLFEEERYRSDYPSDQPPPNPFATVEIRKQYTQQCELEFETPEEGREL